MLGIPHVRTSERKDFKRCQQRWVWNWRQGLVPRIEKPGALWFGIGIHLALQHRYSKPGLARGVNVLKVWREYAGDTQAVIYGDNYSEDKEDFYDAVELGEQMLGNYLDFYGKDPRWHVVSAEQTFELPIPYPRRHPSTGEWLCYYNGTFDLVARDLEGDESLWLWDHKTAKAISTKHLALDDQAGSYWAVAGDVLSHLGLISPGDKLDGILYNFLRKGKADERPVNANGLRTNKPVKAHYEAALREAGIVSVGTLKALQERAEAAQITVLGDESKQQPPPLFHREVVWRTRSERRTQIERIQNEALQMSALRSRVFAPTKNPTTDCSWDCKFFELCQLHEAGDDWREYRDAAFVRRDPYADHRKSADAD